VKVGPFVKWSCFPLGLNGGYLMVVVGFGSSELETNLNQYYSKVMNFGLIRKSQFVFHGVIRTFEKTEGRVWSNLLLLERAIRSISGLVQ
jgi:hypothetical protein